jgi:hypothetical protein
MLDKPDNGEIARRAFAAARVCNLGISENGRHHETADPPVSIQQAADQFEVHRSSVVKARQVLLRGDPTIIANLELGRISVDGAYRTLAHVAHRPKKRRKRAAAPDDRKKTFDEKAAIWGHLKTALEELTSLPLASDVAAVAVALDRTGLIDRKLVPALSWLQEFQRCLSSKS